MVVQSKYINSTPSSHSLSFNHKLKRIKRQEDFKSKMETRYNALTAREIQIVTLLSNGYNNPQISEALFISRCTVEQHRKNINKKLGVNSLLQLFQYSLAFNLV